MGSEITLVQAITLAVAVLGVVLGVINTWHGLDRSRVKLRVNPVQVKPIGAAPTHVRFGIEVMNLSAFPVTIADVGFYHRRTDKRTIYTSPFFIDGGSWPRRLEPRSSVTVYGPRPVNLPGHPLTAAYAKTECGHVKTGTSPALKQLAET